MGFEYKLKAKLTDRQTSEIQNLFESSIHFENKYEFDKKLLWDFRHAENNGKLPNISIIFEHDGIYICQYSTSYVWTDLEALKKYMDGEQIEYEITDYQE